MRLTSFIKFIKLFIAIASVSGCALFRSASTPIPSQYYHYQESNPTLILLLPGRGGSPTNYVKYGTVEQIRACRPDANILGVDSHFGYYREDSIVERLHEDIVKPARLAGIKQVWILGISMGGLGSLVYQQQHPEDIEGLVLMAPFIGEWDELSLYLAAPDRSVLPFESRYKKLWDGLINIPINKTPITLAYGEYDRLNPQHRWLSAQLDESRVVSAPGGHRWTVWKKLWPEALKRSGLCDPV